MESTICMVSIPSSPRILLATRPLDHEAHRFATNNSLLEQTLFQDLAAGYCFSYEMQPGG